MSSTLRHKWQRWCALAAWERQTGLCLWWRLQVAWVLVRIAGIDKSLTRLRALGPAPAVWPQGLDTAGYVRRCEQLTDLAAAHSPLPMNCLPMALGLCHWLRGRGIDARLRIGVERQGAELAAHAWVEYAGNTGNVAAHRYHPIL